MRNAFDVIIAPVVSEKSNAMIESGKYVFKVKSDAGKIEIGKAVEELFNVKVAAVNVSNCVGKAKRVGRSNKSGFTSDWKKAIVTLSEGSIEFF